MHSHACSNTLPSTHMHFQFIQVHSVHFHSPFQNLYKHFTCGRFHSLVAARAHAFWLNKPHLCRPCPCRGNNISETHSSPAHLMPFHHLCSAIWVKQRADPIWMLGDHTHSIWLHFLSIIHTNSPSPLHCILHSFPFTETVHYSLPFPSASFPLHFSPLHSHNPPFHL